MSQKRLWPITLLLIAGVLAFLAWQRAHETAGPAPRAPATASSPAAAPQTGTAVAPRVPVAPTDATANLRAALDAALRSQNPGVRAPDFGQLLQAWIQRDLEGALAYVQQMPRGTSEFSAAVMMVLDALSRRDADRALNLARELVTTHDARAIYSVIFDRLAQADVASAVARLPLVPAGEARENAIRAAADVWARNDLPRALAWAQGVADRADRNAALETTFHELATKDPMQVIELAQKSLSGPALERTVFDALQKLTATDPQGASTLVSLLPAGEMQTLVTVDVARALAAQNIPGALSWARSLPTDAMRFIASTNVLAIWEQQDANAVARYAVSLPPGRENHDAVVHVVNFLAARDPPAAIAWAQSLPSTDPRLAAQPNIDDAWNLRAVAEANLANTWAQRDPAAATRWMAAQPDAAIEPKMLLSGPISYWILQDAPAAQEFVRTLPPAQQLAAGEYAAPLLAQRDPIATLTWAQSLPSPGARNAATAAAFTRWHNNAPAAANAWLETASLPPETKAKLGGK